MPLHPPVAIASRASNHQLWFHFRLILKIIGTILNNTKQKNKFLWVWQGRSELASFAAIQRYSGSLMDAWGSKNCLNENRGRVSHN